MTVALPDGDAELIAAVRSGRTEAYATLCERHREAALALARQLSRSNGDADDVVAVAFTWILGIIGRGAGPAESFRPYLLATVRRVANDRAHGQRTQIATGRQDPPGPDEFPTDPDIAGPEQSLIVRAFRSLPERWQTVLWHTEVEQAAATEVAALLGLTPNGVSALSHRAREGLRQAYLRMYLQELPREECRPAAELLAAHVRGGLSQRDARLVDRHLAECERCRAASAELADINPALRDLATPVIAGGAAAAAQLGGLGALAGAASKVPRLGRFARQRRKVTAAAGIAVLLAAAVALAVTLLPNSGSVPRGRHPVAGGTGPAGPAPAPLTRSSRPGSSSAAPTSAAPSRRPSPASSASAPAASASTSASRSAPPSASASSSAPPPGPSPTSSSPRTPSPSPSPVCVITVPMRICLSL
jgi:RNA polymerase sigma factor (sigma-70 family)